MSGDLAADRSYARKLECASLAFWALKDISWVLLIFPLAACTALVVVCLEVHSLLLVWRNGSKAICVHAAATVLWLIGNSVWMISELLWDGSHKNDVPKLDFPWYQGPSAGDNPKAYHTAKNVSQACFALGFLSLATLYLSCLLKIDDHQEDSANPQEVSANPQEEMEALDSSDKPPLAWGKITQDVYCQVFIFPWIMKDLLWTLDVAPGIILNFVAAALVLDAFRLFKEPASLIEFSWIGADTLWMLGELHMLPAATEYRKISAVALSFTFSLALKALRDMSSHDELEASETTPLRGDATSSHA